MKAFVHPRPAAVIEQGASKMRPMPADFAERAQTMTVKELRAHYRAGIQVVMRWNREVGRTPFVATGTPPRPVPLDFAALAAAMTQTALAEHYDIGRDTIRRWEREAGLPLRDRTGRQRTTAAVAPVKRWSGPTQLFAPKMVAHTRRDFSAAGQAADFLRRFGPVVRCGPDGRYAECGDHWRRGSTVLTPAEVIARAERQGWSAAAWRALTRTNEGA